MSKLTLLLVTTAVAAALSGCVGGGASPIVKAAVPDCVFPDNPSEAAPDWVCTHSAEGLTVGAVGIYEKTGAGAQFQSDQAIASARVNLAQQMKVHVSNMIKQYAETTGAGATETVDKVNTSVSKLITKETISGSRMFKSRTNSKGTLYVLVGIDPGQADKAVKEVVKTSMNNERALWQQFKAAKSQDELANEIAKMDDKK